MPSSGPRRPWQRRSCRCSIPHAILRSTPAPARRGQAACRPRSQAMNAATSWQAWRRCFGERQQRRNDWRSRLTEQRGEIVVHDAARDTVRERGKLRRGPQRLADDRDCGLAPRREPCRRRGCAVSRLPASVAASVSMKQARRARPSDGTDAGSNPTTKSAMMSLSCGTVSRAFAAALPFPALPAIFPRARAPGLQRSVPRRPETAPIDSVSQGSVLIRRHSVLPPSNFRLLPCSLADLTGPRSLYHLSEF